MIQRRRDCRLLDRPRFIPRHQFLTIRQIVSVVLLVASAQYFFFSTAYAFQRASAGPITVGPNIQVSKIRKDQMHWEVLIAADPDNSKNLIACTIVGTEGSRQERPHNVVYASFDGGVTWQETMDVAAEMTAVGDPSCTYGRGGVAYMASLVAGKKVLLSRSADSGKTWGSPIELPSMDREYVTVDNNGSKGRVYVHGTSFLRSIVSGGSSIAEFSLWSSSDGERPFVGPARLATSETGRTLMGMGNGVVLSDGTFVAITGEVNESLYADGLKSFRAIGRILAVSSTDRGQSLLPTGIVSDWTPEIGHRLTSGVLPVLAVDGSQGPFKDRLYAVWLDSRLSRRQVMISRSSDRGKTWSPPLVVNDDAPHRDGRDGPHNALPTVAVNPYGVVGVMWYDRRDSPDNLAYRPRFAASMDGAETFLPSVAISEASSSIDRSGPLRLTVLDQGQPNHGKLAFSIGVYMRQFSGGDTSGLSASADGLFHPLWIDNRTGVMQVWTTTVSVAGDVSRTDSEEFPLLADITDRIALDLRRVVYDPSKHLVAVDASIENMSKDIIRGPIKLHLLSLSSLLGPISVLNSDNHIEGAGTVWDFTEQLENGMLKAGARSRPRRLEFRIAKIPEGDRPYDALVRMINIRARVLSKR